MSTKYKSGAISEDFPLYHNENTPIYYPNNLIKHHKKVSDIRIMVSNEHPDIFRIKGMKEGGYINPHLKEVLKVDREEYFKKFQEISKKIKLIDLIKSSKQYSQNPKYLNLINNESYINKKKTIDFSNSSRNVDNNAFSISLENNNNLLNKALRTLNMERERITRNNIKKNLDLEKTKKVGGNYIIFQDDFNKLRKIKSDININKSSYTSNYNSFKISESLKEDKTREFFYPRKPVYKLNPLLNTKTIFKPPPYAFPKWSQFSENYFALSNTPKGLLKKGGLFTEFVNKNFDKIKVINNDIKKKLKQEREKNNLKKMKYSIDEIQKDNNRKNKFKAFSPVNKYTNTNNSLFDKMKKLGVKNNSYRSIFEVNKLK